MRPRVFPAEDAERGVLRSGDLHASMRPRVFPAEDSAMRATVSSGSWSFNEAAGIPRGRPRPVRWGRCRLRRFNEAAGIPRGRLALAHMGLRLLLGLQ